MKINLCSICGKTKKGKGPLCRQCYRNSVAQTKTFVCHHCQKIFIPKRASNSIYCSSDCSKMAKTKRKQERLNQKKAIKDKGKICQICGMIFYPIDWHQKFCSLECRKNKRKDGYKKDNERRKILARGKAIPKGYRICRECGREFQPIYGEKLKIFCSIKCQKRNTQRNREHNRRFRMRKQKGDGRVYKQRIYLRDEGKCQICGKKVMFNKIAPHPYSPTLDHIIPLSMGGIHKPANVQLAHFRCNVKKQNKISDKGNQLFLFG